MSIALNAQGVVSVNTRVPLRRKAWQTLLGAESGSSGLNRCSAALWSACNASDHAASRRARPAQSVARANRLESMRSCAIAAEPVSPPATVCSYLLKVRC